MLHMKVRDETFSKPKLSHPKETRNREREAGMAFIQGRENRRFSEGSCESESRGEVEGLKLAHAACNHFDDDRLSFSEKTKVQAPVLARTWPAELRPIKDTQFPSTF